MSNGKIVLIGIAIVLAILVASFVASWLHLPADYRPLVMSLAGGLIAVATMKLFGNH